MRALALDRDRKKDSQRQREAFERVRRAETQYARKLRQVARQIQDLVQAFATGHPDKPIDPQDIPALISTLQRYGDVLQPWAKATVAKMLADVSKRDERAWFETASSMSHQLRRELREAPVGKIFHAHLNEQVALITSLPTDAAQRVHELAEGGLYSGARYPEVAKEILRTGHVTQARANTIARTEVARTSSVLTQARAEYIGSTSYIWRTSKDTDVRSTHRKVADKAYRWDDPPLVEPARGMHYHPGQTFNCRCYAEVILPAKYL